MICVHGCRALNTSSICCNASSSLPRLAPASGNICDSSAVRFAGLIEGADVAVVYHKHHEDAAQTKAMVNREGRKCIVIAGDVGDKAFCGRVVLQTVDSLGKLDILVNHAGIQFYHESIEETTEDELEKTFRTNVYSQFFMAQAALKHLKAGSSIINTASVNSFKGHPNLVDYSASKGANTSFTYALAQQLASKGIRVNSVAPGPIWTPLIPATFPAEKLKDFGKNVLLGRPGQPDEVAPSYVFLASEVDSSFITGQTLHPNGGSRVK